MSIQNEAVQIEITIAPAKGRRGGRKAAGPKVPDPPRIARITRLTALAIRFQDMVDCGEVRDYADLARLGYVTRARLTQIMNLLNLAPDIQEELLTLSTLPAQAELSERCLRQITAVVGWSQQRRLWKELPGKPSTER
jgi:hypothetical protein